MKNILIMLFCCFLLLTANAQNAARERIEAMKIAFITKRLQLTPEEAQKFWPVYNRFTEEMEKLRKSAKTTLIDELENPLSLSDAEADKALQEMNQFKQNEADLIRRYAAEFKKVLPVQKVVMLFKAENDFKKELLKQLKNRQR